jgi:hypothetical protein
MSLDEKLDKLNYLFYEKYHSRLSFNNLWQEVLDSKFKLPKSKVKEWYDSQSINQIFKKNEPQNLHIIAYNFGMIQADLMDFTRFNPKLNKGHRYLCVMIDVKSRYCWVEPLKKKTPKEIFPLLKSVYKIITKQREIEKSTFPITFTSDVGNEFMGEVDKFCKDNNIERYFADPSTNTKSRTYIVERMNRTIWDLLKKPLEEQDNNKWLALIDVLIEEYNNRVHSSLNYTPQQVLYENKLPVTPIDDENNNNFKVGDIVRVQEDIKLFDKKSLTPTFSKNLFEIVEKIQNRFKVVNTSTNRHMKKLFLPSQMIHTKGEEIGQSKQRETIKYKKEQTTKRKNIKTGLEVDKDNGQIIVNKRLVPKSKKREIKKPSRFLDLN